MQLFILSNFLTRQFTTQNFAILGVCLDGRPPVLKIQKTWIRRLQRGPGGPRTPEPPLKSTPADLLRLFKVAQKCV